MHILARSERGAVWSEVAPGVAGDSPFASLGLVRQGLDRLRDFIANSPHEAVLIWRRDCLTLSGSGRKLGRLTGGAAARLPPARFCHRFAVKDGEADRIPLPLRGRNGTWMRGPRVALARLAPGFASPVATCRGSFGAGDIPDQTSASLRAKRTDRADDHPATSSCRFHAPWQRGQTRTPAWPATTVSVPRAPHRPQASRA